ncbi:MAG: hypothetical protein SVV03_02525 [Candidatus Nanohaloarchaea archaeon]|nr:hypothetical protein [Candidatus Nanohaloarchaea archaeon]
MNLHDYKEWHEDNYNFMTPKIEELREAETREEEIVIELARSRDTRDHTQYGVSVFRKTEEGFEPIDYEINRPFWDFQNAVHYINNDVKEYLKENFDNVKILWDKSEPGRFDGVRA